MITRYFARRAFLRAAAELRAYQTQPADGMWNIVVATTLQVRLDRAARKYATTL